MLNAKLGTVVQCVAAADNVHGTLTKTGLFPEPNLAPGFSTPEGHRALWKIKYFGLRFPALTAGKLNWMDLMPIYRIGQRRGANSRPFRGGLR